MNDNGNGRIFKIDKFGVSVGTLLLILAQSTAIVGWIVSDHANLERLKEDFISLRQQVNTYDVNGSRYSNLLSQHINQLEANQAATDKRENDIASRQRIHDEVESRLENQLNLIKQELQRQEEQQSRVIQALDNTYDLLNQHLREHADHPERGPPPLNLGHH